MRIVDKLQMDRKGLVKYGPINVVAFGDSVTHGALNIGEMDFESVYHNRLKKKIEALGSYYPVNVINAGIGGITAAKSLGRMDSQVLRYDPDLVIVCFGLNDVNRDKEIYLDALKTIFDRCKEAGSDVIFMTPNMLNTYVAEDTHPEHAAYAAKTALMQTSGRMDEYMFAARDMAVDMGVPVCDCYSKWKKLSETQDTTLLLANRINHPQEKCTSCLHKVCSIRSFQVIRSRSKAPTMLCTGKPTARIPALGGSSATKAFFIEGNQL